jgi:predicted DNA-binding transcriptional regulator AlpA
MNSLLTARQAAELLGISVRSFYRLPIRRYTLAPRLTRWAVQDLEEF